MVSVLVVGLASLPNIVIFLFVLNWALFASVLVLAWLRCLNIVCFYWAVFSSGGNGVDFGRCM